MSIYRTLSEESGTTTIIDGDGHRNVPYNSTWLRLSGGTRRKSLYSFIGVLAFVLVIVIIAVSVKSGKVPNPQPIVSTTIASTTSTGTKPTTTVTSATSKSTTPSTTSRTTVMTTTRKKLTTPASTTQKTTSTSTTRKPLPSHPEMQNLFRKPTILMSYIKRSLNKLESSVVLVEAQGFSSLSMKAAETMQSIPGTISSIDFDYEMR